MLIELASGHKKIANNLISQRGLLVEAIAGKQEKLQQALIVEQEAIKAADRKYWQPLKQELELLRRD